MKLSKKQRAQVFQMFGGKCAYCGCDLPEAGWHADHVEPVVRNGHWVRVNEPHRTHKYVQDGTCQRPESQRIDNFFPSCASCNINKASCHIELWRECLERLAAGMRRDHASFRHAERFGLVTVNDQKVRFYFERLKETP